MLRSSIRTENAQFLNWVETWSDFDGDKGLLDMCLETIKEIIDEKL